VSSLAARKIRLRYEGRCRRCGRRIPAGTQAYWESGKGVWHLQCGSLVGLSSGRSFGSTSDRFRTSHSVQLGLIFAVIIVLALGGALASSRVTPPMTTARTETERSHAFQSSQITQTYATTSQIPYLTYATMSGTKTTPATKGMFVGSRLSNIYHWPSCYWAKQINPKNEIWFKDSADAIAHGYRPCKVCKPP
jgi:hypothetical protein